MTRARRDQSRSLKSSGGFVDFVLDQLSGLGDVTSKSMFGGTGLYCGDLFFGIVARDQLYLKTDDRNRAAFDEAGSRPFKPYSDRPGTMQYYDVPVAVLESAPELVKWARDAVAAAARNRPSSGKPGSSRRR